MEKRRRLVAVDYGTQRVGVAVTDPLRMFTRPEGTYSADEALEMLQRLETTDGIEQIIVGWPLNLEGEEGKATQRVEAFLERLQKLFPEIPVVKWDERFSSARAREKLYAADAWKKVKQDKAMIDAVAAAVILEEYLEQYPDMMS